MTYTDDHEFDEEFEGKPEGTILTPIFLGCGAMGLGCLFSSMIIAVGIFLVAPNILDVVTNWGDPFQEQVTELVYGSEEVMQVLGADGPGDVTIESTDQDGDVGVDENGEEIELTYGEEFTRIIDYTVTGPSGVVTLHAEGENTAEIFTESTLLSVIATLPDGTQLRLYPVEGEVPPPPRQLAPPEETGATASDVEPEHDNVGIEGDEAPAPASKE